jgi:hypothetical protein
MIDEGTCQGGVDASLGDAVEIGKEVVCRVWRDMHPFKGLII